MRTSGDPECTSPITSATASSVLAPSPEADARVVNPWIRKCPQRVGKSADATCFTLEELTLKLYRSKLGSFLPALASSTCCLHPPATKRTFPSQAWMEGRNSLHTCSYDRNILKVK